MIKNILKSRSKGTTIAKYILILTIVILGTITISYFGYCTYFSKVFINFQKSIIQLNQRNTINQILELRQQIPRISLQLLEDTTVSYVLTSEHTDRTKQIPALINIQSSNLYNDFTSLTVYNIKNGYIYSDSNGLDPIPYNEYKEKNPEFDKILTLYQNGQNFITFEEKNSSGTKSTYVTYAYSDYRGFIFFYNIGKKDILMDILKVDSVIPYTSWLYLDDKLICTDDDSDYDILNNSAISKKFESADFFSFRKFLYVSSSGDGFTCVSKVRYSDLLKGASKTISFIVFFALMVIAICSIIIIFFEKNSKKITKKFLGKIADLEHDSEKLEIQSIIHKLFSNSSVTQRELSFFGKTFTVNNTFGCTAILITVDGYKKMIAQNGFDDMAIIKYGINNIAEEIFSHIGKCKGICLNQNGIVLVLSSDKQDLNEKLQNAIRKLSQTIENHFNITLSYAISEYEETLSDIPKNFNALIHLGNYRFVKGYKSVIFQENYEHQAEKPESFPTQIADKLIDAINEENDAEIDNCIFEFSKYVVMSNLPNAQEWLLTLFMYISKKTRFTETPDEALDVLNNLIQCDIFQDGISIIRSFILKKEPPETSSNNDSADNFEELAKKMIVQKYSEPDFNINMLAEKLDITPAYAGRKFSKVFGKSFNAYLAEYRIDTATYLLQSMDIKISKISEMCGFNSTTYFVTIFKKHIGITPQQYREDSKLIN